jgi:hypothetical protein
MASKNEVRLQLKGGRTIKIVRTETPTGGMWSIPEMPEIAAHQNISVIRDRLRGKGLIASRPGAKATFKVEDRFYFGKGRKERFSSIMAEISSAEDAVYDGRDVAGVKIQELLAKMRKGLMTSEEKKRLLEVVQEAKAYGMFSRPGQPERFGASDKVDSLIATAYRALRNGDKAAARRLIASAEALVQSDSSVPNYIVNELKDLKKSLRFSRPGNKARFADDRLAKFLDVYNRNEDNNYHSENVVLLAKFLGSTDDVAQAQRIANEQRRSSDGISEKLYKERTELNRRLLSKFRSRYPQADI